MRRWLVQRMRKLDGVEVVVYAFFAVMLATAAVLLGAMLISALIHAPLTTSGVLAIAVSLGWFIYGLYRESRKP